MNEKSNKEIVKLICKILDKKYPSYLPHSRLIRYVPDRPGHDKRYAIDANKLKKELGWEPSLQFEEGLAKTIAWYLENEQWINNITSGEYKNYYKEMTW